MYDLKSYGAMITDEVRMDAFEEALRRVITPDSVVLDIGAGTGIMSLVAARLGAKRVYAVELNPLVRIGARLAAENGFADRIVFVHGRSEQIELPELADVVVCDLRGGLPNVPGHIDAIVDARQRLMKPDGALIPRRDVVFVAPVQAEEAFSEIVSPWRDQPRGFQMSGAGDAAIHRGLINLASIDQLLGPGQAITTLDYRVVTSPNLDVSAELNIDQPGVMHGLSVWFEADLIDGVGFSTAPDLEKTVYGRVFLPLPDGVEVEKDDRVRAKIRAKLDEDPCIWVWRGRIEGDDGSAKAKFSSSSAFFNPESPAVREVIHDGCAPWLSEDGGIAREVLVGIDGVRCVADLAAAIMAKNPGRFEYEEDAVIFVRDVVEKYGEAVLRLED